MAEAGNSRPEVILVADDISANVELLLDQLHSLEHGGADIFLTEPLPRGTLLSVIERLLKSGTAA